MKRTEKLEKYRIKRDFKRAAKVDRLRSADCLRRRPDKAPCQGAFDQLEVLAAELR